QSPAATARYPAEGPSLVISLLFLLAIAVGNVEEQRSPSCKDNHVGRSPHRSCENREDHTGIGFTDLDAGCVAGSNWNRFSQRVDWATFQAHCNRRGSDLQLLVGVSIVQSHVR